VSAADPATWIGRRDRAILLMASQTGLRNSEITALRWQDVAFGTGAHVRCLGKGRKTRCTPLHRNVADVMRAWKSEQRGAESDPAFPSSRGGPLSPDALQRLVRSHVAEAAHMCPSLSDKHVTPHTLRHTAAMTLLQHGVNLTVIALWLGHESTETTQIYIHADMKLKEQALGHATPGGVVPDRYCAPDSLLAFLESL
jgi:integrase/recombinase XerD